MILIFSCRYLGYGNEETQWVTDLKPSLGEAARNEQTRNAEQAEVEAEAPEADRDENKEAAQIPLAYQTVRWSYGLAPLTNMP